MSEIKSFIDNARKKGLSDDSIRAALEAEGWNEAIVTTALAGLEVPSVAPSSPPKNSEHSQSLHPMLAALQHIFLWAFIGASIPTIITITLYLYGGFVPTQQLRTVGAITLTSFAIYVAFYAVYLSKVRKNPNVTPNRIWSIITVCGHSIMALIATYVLIISFVNASTYTSDVNTTQVSAGLLLALALIVTVTYAFAAFATSKKKRRKIVLYIHIPLIIVLYGVLGIIALFQEGARSHDEQVRKDLITATEAIRSYTDTHQSLPATGGDITLPANISYNKKSEKQYELCGTFKGSTIGKSQASYPSPSPSYNYDNDGQYGYPGTKYDNPVYESSFYSRTNGNACFTLNSYALSVKKSQTKPSPQDMIAQ